ncbi:Bromodomain-containing protein, partial [Atractiella rhizophila]
RNARAFPFHNPVDPIALQIPHYFDIIPRKDARDLSTIRKHLDQDRYRNFDEFEADVKLMLKNCYTFNASDTPVYASGREFERLF